jgi:sulfur carrier protein ThiS adenylyltransferase
MGDNRKDTGAPKGILSFVSYFGGMLEAAMVLTFLNTGMCGDEVFWFDLRKGKFESVSFERREGCPVCSSAKR